MFECALLYTIVYMQVCSLVVGNDYIDFLTSYETFTPVVESSKAQHRVGRSFLGKAGGSHNAPYIYTFSGFGCNFTLILTRQELFAEKPVISIHERRGHVQEQELNVEKYVKGTLAGKLPLPQHDNAFFGKIL